MAEKDDLVGRALDQALAAVLAARTLHRAQMEAADSGECLHSGAVEVLTMGARQRLCPECGLIDG